MIMIIKMILNISWNVIVIVMIMVIKMILMILRNVNCSGWRMKIWTESKGRPVVRESVDVFCAQVFHRLINLISFRIFISIYLEK